ncbi:hypothetical protein KIN20_031611 [Parelaphostrongylus tenuis]|uniref:Uncharacterized protein n=1 Tax=Parelaphostrongylus tenuis TaxID=148309 RepID=A0AAD5R5W2_PARTN|nr:hypothetical protein KIN20_031611 [Parelaphostrongylus tenuis]
MPILVQSACEALAQSKAAAAIHGYYDPNYADRFTFLNSENAAMLLHRFDTLNKIYITNESTEPAADSDYSLFLCAPKSLFCPFRAFHDDSSIQSLIDESLGGESGEINWESTALLLGRISSDLKETGKSSAIEAFWNVFEKVDRLACQAKDQHRTLRAKKPGSEELLL